MKTMSVRRLLWIAVGGLALGILGFGWDTIWHSNNADNELSGMQELIEAHWLMLVGIVIIFIALAMAVRLVRQTRSVVVSTWVAFVGSLAMVLGFAWDSVYHVQGTESPTAHSLIYIGLMVVVLGLTAALVFSRNRGLPASAEDAE